MNTEQQDWRAALTKDRDRGERSFWIALFLSTFAGVFALDRFYLGYRGIGLLKLITLGGLAQWWILDVILILSDNMTDADGNHLKH